MMKKKEIKARFLKTTTLWIVGIFAVLFLALVLLWHGNANSMQAVPAMVAGVYFDGEYRVADGQWQKIETGKPVMTEFDDVIIHRIVNSIQVTKDLNLRIFIKGGAEIVEPLFPPEEESA